MAAFFRSAFEKLSMQQQERIVEATEYTAMQVSPQGDLFGIFVDMAKYLKELSEKGVRLDVKSKGAKKIAAATQGIGAGMKMIAEALNAIPDGKDAEQKMNAIATGVDALSALGPAILKFAGMLALSLPLMVLGIPALMLAIPMIAAVGGIFYLLGKLGITKEIKEVATGLAIAGLAMISLAGGIVLTEMILNYAGNPLRTLAMVSALILGTATVFGIAGIFAGFIKKGAMAMLFSALPILAIAASMAIFTAAVPPTKDGWESIAQVSAVVTGLGLLMAGAGAASAFIIPGAAAMILAGGALISVAFGLQKIADVLKPGKLDYLFADSGHATKGVKVFGVTIIEGGRPMSNLEWALLSIARSFMLPPLAIAGMYAGAPALIMSGLALVSIAKGIEKFQAMDIDYEKLPMQIAKTTTVLATAFAKVGEKYPGGGAGFIGAMFGSGSNTSVVAQGISAVSGMGRALTGIATGVQAMAELRFPTKWDKDGNPIEFRTLTPMDFVMVGINTQLIVSALSKTFSEVGASDAAKGSTWFSSSDYEKGIKVVRKMGDPLVKLAEFVKTFSDKGITDDMIAGVSQKTQSIIRGLTSAFMVDVDGNAIDPRDMRIAANAYKKMANSTEDMAEGFVEFKDGINDLDLEKVVEVRKMYESLAALSKSDGNVVEEMSEAMIEAIELLAEKLGDFKSDLETATTAPKQTALQKAVAATSSGSTEAKPGTSNADVIAAINKLTMSLSGTLPVYVTNQEGGL